MTIPENSVTKITDVTSAEKHSERLGFYRISFDCLCGFHFKYSKELFMHIGEARYASMLRQRIEERKKENLANSPYSTRISEDDYFLELLSAEEAVSLSPEAP